MRRPVLGAKGSDAPYEASDTLRSTQIARIVDLLGEGPIGGLVNGLKSVYLDGVPVENADGSKNFAEFGYRLTLGGPTSEADHGFGEVQTEVAVGVTVLAAVPVVRTITDVTADQVRVTLTVPTLLEQRDNGDRVGAAFELAIDIQSNGGGYVQRFTDTISGKASAPYNREVKLSLTEVGPPPWDVRVRRITADSASPSLQNAFAWASYTVITGVRMLYRNSAVNELTFDARNFSAIPSRWYDVWGMVEWEIPVNYDPLLRTVAGPWNGTWKLGPTNNPAWVLHNLVRHPRYGLGNYVVQLPDKWTLYQLALWCDEPLPDGRGGFEPRYSINAWIVEQREALQLLQEICSVFRGVLMHGGSTLTVTWDAPGEPVASYTPANVVDGLFTYADGSAADRKTSCTCWYTDRTQAGKRVPVTWDDAELVAELGMRPMEIKPLGVATEAQALRMAKWALFTVNAEAQTVAFRIGAEGPVRRLGEVFQIMDPSETGERLGGRIHAATTTVVELDGPVTLASGETYTLWVAQPHATDPAQSVLQGRTVTTAAGTASTLTVSPAFDSAPLVGTVWLLEGTDVQPTLWRYVAITPATSEDGQEQFDVLGQRHEPGKWALIEADQPLTPRPIRRLPYGAPPVGTITIEEEVYFDDVGVAHIRATVSWPVPGPGLRYVVRWRVDNGTWHQELPISHNTIEGNDLAPGVYDVQVQSLNGLGQLSIPTSATATLLGTLSVPDPTGFGYVGRLGQVVLSWNEPLPPLLFSSELRLGASWDVYDTVLWRGKSTDWKHARPANGTYKVWLAHCVVKGQAINYSANPVSLDVTVDDSIDGGGGGAVKLTTDRFPVFLYADGSTHTTTSAELVLTALLLGLHGSVTWTATAYDADVGGTDLGPVTLGGSGLVRTLTGADFAAPGAGGLVKRVTVRIDHTTGAFDELDVYRADPSITTPRLVLRNAVAGVPTDEYGNLGDYSDANTDVAVYVGLNNVIDTWSTAIDPDAGVVTTINGGAGPVTSTLAVNVAVSDMAPDSAVVEIQVSKTGETTLVGFFRLEKNKGGEQLVYWDPRTRIDLQVGADGKVPGFTDAWSALMIERSGGNSDVANWQFSKRDIGVTSELTGNRVDITGVAEVGSWVMGLDTTPGIPGNTTTTDAYPPGTPIANFRGVDHDAGTWVMAFNTSSSKVLRSTAYTSGWVLDDVGAVGEWVHVGKAQGAWVVVENNFGHRTRRSVDNGVTWAAGSNLPVGAGQISNFKSNGKTLLGFAQSAGQSNVRSVDGGLTWTLHANPSGFAGLQAWPCGNAGEWVARDPSNNAYRSLDDGATWTDIDSQLDESVWSAIKFKGRSFIAYWGSSNKLAYFEPGSATAKKITLPETYNTGVLMVIGDVLYLVWPSVPTTNHLLFTVDGLTWRVGSPLGFSGQAVPGLRDLTEAYIPIISDGYLAVKLNLATASDTVRGVEVTATQKGRRNIVRLLPVHKASAPSKSLSFGVSASPLWVPATADGKVTDYSQATLTVWAEEDGEPQTGLWTCTWTATNLTPASGSGATITFTAMSDAADSGLVNIRLSRAGYEDVTGTVEVRKVKGTDSSAPRQSAAYSPIVVVGETLIGLRFRPDGQVYRKVGTGGTYLPFTRWAGAVIPNIGNGYYIKATLRSGSHALATGAVGTYQQINVDRDFELSDAASGDHAAYIDWWLSPTGSDSDAINNFSELRLEVP